MTWQNPGALHALDGLDKGGPVQARGDRGAHPVLLLVLSPVPSPREIPRDTD